MNVYVIGAGVSKTIGYPLGSQMFEKIDAFLKERQLPATEWQELCSWLENNPDPLIEAAHQRRDLEALFTVVDLARLLRMRWLSQIAHHMHNKRGDQAAREEESGTPSERGTESHRRFRETLLSALGHFLQFKHHQDRGTYWDSKWEALRKFGKRLREGDVIITFNYDSTIERVLLEQNKWTPKDGYGFEVELQQSVPDTVSGWGCSPVKILHLHGAVGWLKNVRQSPAAPRIAIDANFLQSLRTENSDLAPCAATKPDSGALVIHPSFIKDYEEDWSLIDLWQLAAESLKRADQTYVIGYSLPSADSAALTLLLTNCVKSTYGDERVHIVNPDIRSYMRLRQLLTWRRSPLNALDGAISFEQWLDQPINNA